MIQDDKRLSDMEAALSKLTRRVDKGFAETGRLIAMRLEAEELARLRAEIIVRDKEIDRLHMEIHKRNDEIGRLSGASGGLGGQGAGGQVAGGARHWRQTSIPKMYARTRRKVLTQLNGNEKARRVMAQLPGGVQSVLRVQVMPGGQQAVALIPKATPAVALPAFDPRKPRKSNLAGDERISIERLCLIAEGVRAEEGKSAEGKAGEGRSS